MLLTIYNCIFYMQTFFIEILHLLLNFEKKLIVYRGFYSMFEMHVTLVAMKDAPLWL